jgi:hypothetical protein
MILLCQGLHSAKLLTGLEILYKLQVAISSQMKMTGSARPARSSWLLLLEAASPQLSTWRNFS